MKNLRLIPDFRNPQYLVKTFFVFDKILYGFPEMQIVQPFSSLSIKSLATIKDRPELETSIIVELIPNYTENKDAELEKRSAVKWVDKFPNNVPILMMHGNADWRVKPEQSLNLTLEFEKNRIPYKLIIFEGGDHGISEHKKEVNEQVLKWFDKYLKKASTLPNM